MSRVRNLSVIAIIAMLCALWAPGVRAETRMVAYFDDSGPRVDAALQKLRQALSDRHVTARHEIRVRHFVVDHQDRDNIRRGVQEALDAGAVALIATTVHVAYVARLMTHDVPIIFAAFQEPVKYGLVRAVREPGSNITGFTFYQPVEMKRVELLREIDPRIRKLGVIIDRGWYLDPVTPEFEPQLRSRFAMEATTFFVEDERALKALLDDPRARAMDAWYVPTVAFPFDHPALFVREIARFRKPVVYARSLFPANGGLISYQPVIEDPFATWAVMLGMILDGTPPAEIPVERPKSFELEINLATARSQGIAIPKTLLEIATKVHR